MARPKKPKVINYKEKVLLKALQKNMDEVGEGENLNFEVHDGDLYVDTKHVKEEVIDQVKQTLLSNERVHEVTTIRRMGSGTIYISITLK